MVVYLFTFHYYLLSLAPLHNHTNLWETFFDLILIFTVATEIKPESLLFRMSAEKDDV